MNVNRIKTLGPAVVRWFPEALVHGEGGLEGEPFVLRDAQEEACHRWFAFTDDYDWVFDRFYNEEPKGVGKTMFLAGLAIEHSLGPSSVALGRRRPNVVVAANSVRQAGEKRGGKSKDDPEDFGDGIFGRICQVLDHDNCVLKSAVKIYGDRVAFQDRPGGIRLVPSRASTVDGGLPTLYVADEVQDWTGNSAEAYDRIENSTTKGTPPGRTIAASTPGARVGDPSIGWRLRSLGDRIRSGEVDDPTFLFINHEASAHWDLSDPEQRAQALLECTPGLEEGSKRHRKLVRRYDEITEDDYRRFHLAQWTDTDPDSWLADRPGAWAHCSNPSLVAEVLGDAVRPDPDVAVEDTDPVPTEDYARGRGVWAAVDMSLKNDLSAVAWGTILENDMHVVRCRVFEPGKQGVIDHHNITAHVRWLSYRYREGLRSVLYDQRFFQVPAEELSDDGVPVVEFPQSMDRMAPACRNAWDLIVAGDIAHDGDTTFARHVNAAARRIYDRGWTLSKGKSGNHIDGCIAMVMQTWAAQTGIGAETPVAPWVISR